MATRVLDEIKFCEKLLKRTSQGTFLPSLVQIGSVVWEEKMFKEIVDDGHSTTLKAPLEHVVLRCAKSRHSFKNVTLKFDLYLCTTRCVSMRCAFIPNMSLVTKLVQE